MEQSSIRSCKVCNNNLIKISQPRSPQGFKGHKDDKGRWWVGRVCPDCAPKFRKVRYRKLPEQYEQVDCRGCGRMFRPIRKNASQTCSGKCAMRVKRGNSIQDLHKDAGLLKTKLPIP